MAAEKKKVKPIDFESNTFKQMKDDMMSELNVLLREWSATDPRTV